VSRLRHKGSVDPSAAGFPRAAALPRFLSTVSVDNSVDETPSERVFSGDLGISAVLLKKCKSYFIDIFHALEFLFLQQI
jgi:hypothetical protein